jgi:hypothetical protein
MPGEEHMSNAKVIAQLRGWKGPYFPNSLGSLHSAYAAWAPPGDDPDYEILKEVAHGVAGYRNVGTEQTEDGYLWSRSLTFKGLRAGGLLAGQVIILFPYSRDSERQNGTATDRSIAAYCSDAVRASEVDEIVGAYCNKFVGVVARIRRESTQRDDSSHAERQQSG